MTAKSKPATKKHEKHEREFDIADTDPIPPALLEGEPEPAKRIEARGPIVGYLLGNGIVTPAIVVASHDDGSLNLHVFSDASRSIYVRNVKRGNAPGCWEVL